MKSSKGEYGLLTAAHGADGWVINLYSPESRAYPPKLGTEKIHFESLDALIAGGWVVD
jgi:hypothetical protein